MQNKKYNNKSGYTLIETMISIALFIIIVMMGANSLLNAGSLYNKSKGMRSIMDGLSFTMDDISRSLRTGYNFACNNSGGSSGAPSSGQNCNGITLIAQDGSNVAYRLSGGAIQKYISATGSWVQITPTEATITIAPFSVWGAEPPSSNDYQQPFVNIRLVGTITYNAKVSTTFSLQTSVSQRNLDL